jgi:hypothetical protein
MGVNFQAQAEGKKAEDIVQMLLDAVAEPKVEQYGRSGRR